MQVAINPEKTKFKWVPEQSKFYPKEISTLSASEISHAKFQEKLTWFRLKLEALRVSWQNGHEVLHVDRWNILFSSLNGVKALDLYK
jgi:hypothetical protein